MPAGGRPRTPVICRPSASPPPSAAVGASPARRRRSRATLVHAGTFFLFASAYWALLPLIARDQLRGGAHVYGMLFGAIGAGAVAGALVLPAIRGRVSPDRLVLGGGLVTAAATAALAATHKLVLAMPIM